MVRFQRADIDKQTYHFQVRFPHMHVLGNYSIDGKIARMIIKGQGDFDLDICKYRSLNTLYIMSILCYSRHANVHITAYQRVSNAINIVLLEIILKNDRNFDLRWSEVQRIHFG